MNRDKYVILPVLEGLTALEIKVFLETLGLYVYFIEINVIKEQSHLFVTYHGDLKPGCKVKINQAIDVVISANLDQYYFFKPMLYEGPRLNKKMIGKPWFIESVNGLMGSGGAFYVRYLPKQGKGTSIDGDTTMFWYPKKVYKKIPSRAKSVRYFLVNAKEVWLGGEEKWGYTATEYVENILVNAESIVLQTDPNDRLVDPFGRLLAWVWVKDFGRDEYYLVNYLLIRQGLGEVTYRFGAGRHETMRYLGKNYEDYLNQAYDMAMNDTIGIHGNKLDYYWDDEANLPNEHHPIRNMER